MAYRWRREKLDYLGGRDTEVVPKSLLGNATFVSIEYPGILTRDEGSSSAPQDDGRVAEASNTDTLHPSLCRALASLAPMPAPYATANQGLEHVGRVIQNKKTSLDCRLFEAIRAGNSSKNAEQDHTGEVHSDNSLYRHAINGNIVDTHNIIIKIRKRTWRRRRRHATDAPTSEPIEEMRKEYIVETLGVANKTARFRTMADFMYDPGLVYDAETGNRSSIHEEALHVHDFIRQMDTMAMCNYDFESEDEEYDKEVAGETFSNVRMPPSFLFAKSEFPFSYGFRQNPSSALVDEDSDGQVSQRKRYANTSRGKIQGPKVFYPFDKDENAKEPPSAYDKAMDRQTYDQRLLNRLSDLFEEQPMWSRIALLNHFPAEQRRQLQNQKHHITKSCYTIGDGCWRDNLVRFGYDPRKDPESRFYQRIVFQSKARAIRRAGARQDPSTIPARDTSQVAMVPQDEPTADDLDGKTHIFDGITPGLTRGNYRLIDIRDEVVKELIDKTGPGFTVDDASQLDRTSGWYTEEHWARIRAVLEVRMDALITTGKPATREACEARLQKLTSVAGVAQQPTRRSTSAASNLELE